jgi:hypothetical protein
MTTVATSASRADVSGLMRRLPGILSGRLPDEGGIAAGFRARLTFVLFALIQDRFEKLGRGGSDENGEEWAPLSKSYLAYQRPTTGRGRPMGGGKAGGSGEDGLLTDAEDAAWWAVYRRHLGFLATRHPIKKAKGIAAAKAWQAVKGSGGQTKIDDAAFGGRQIGDYQVLFDSGTLFVSLSVGELSESGAGASYSPSSPEQIAREEPGKLVVGSSVPYAIFHHKGKGRAHRSLWPDPIPSSWWRQILDQALAGLTNIRIDAGGGAA